MRTAVIGSGLAGLAAAQRLTERGVTATVYEASGHWGGHTHSQQTDGFWFDEGPHISFTRDDRVRKLFDAATASVSRSAEIGCYYKGHWVRHPAQVHLQGLPPELITSCVVDMVATQSAPPEVNNYADWLVGTYGRTFAETFPFAYTRKYWTVEAADMTTEWVGSRMQQPSLREMVLGALVGDQTGEFHYLNDFRYPLEGGFAAYVQSVADEGRSVSLGKEVIAVDVSAHRLHFSDGTSETYDRLVSTMPLDRLVSRIVGVDVPSTVRHAADALLCTSVVLVDIGVRRPGISPWDWMYLYDDHLMAARVSVPSRLAASMAPDGCSSVQAEVYFSRRKPLACSVAEVVERVAVDLVEIGILAADDDVVVRRGRVIDYANVVYTHAHTAAAGTARHFVADCNIELAGRYGEWRYYWTDDAVISGWRAADAIAST